MAKKGRNLWYAWVGLEPNVVLREVDYIIARAAQFDSEVVTPPASWYSSRPPARNSSVYRGGAAELQSRLRLIGPDVEYRDAHTPTNASGEKLFAPIVDRNTYTERLRATEVSRHLQQLSGDYAGRIYCSDPHWKADDRLVHGARIGLPAGGGTPASGLSSND